MSFISSVFIFPPFPFPPPLPYLSYYRKPWYRVKIIGRYKLNKANRVYPDRDTNANACKDFKASGMTQDMYLLASILIHEYV